MYTPVIYFIARSAGAVGYTDSITAEGIPNEYPGYKIKRFDDDYPVLELWECGVPPLIAITTRSTQTPDGRNC